MATQYTGVVRGTPIIIKCNYHTKWQNNKNMRFVLGEVSGDRVRLYTRRTNKNFWTNKDDLIFITSNHNISKAIRLNPEEIKSFPHLLKPHQIKKLEGK